MKRALFAVLVMVSLGAGSRFLWEGKDRQQGETASGALQALGLWSAQRAYPHASVPADRFYRAWEEMARSRNVLDRSIDPWASMGPVNMGGRTLAIDFDPVDPDIVYAGAASGGLWRSMTGGVGVDAWDYVETGYPVLGVSCIAVDPRNRDVIYIGTGEVYQYQASIGGAAIRTTRGSYGIGILKSTDWGATWQKSLDWAYADTRGIWSIQFHPTDSHILFAATTEGIYRTTDAGQTWVQVLDELMGTDLRIHPTDPDILYAACGNFGSTGHGLYRSTDGGDTWRKMAGGLPSSWSGKALLDVTPAAPERVYASIGNLDNTRGLYRSDDAGDSWSLINTTDYAQYQGWFSHWVLASPTDPDIVLVGGIDIWASDDAGSSLERRSNWALWSFGTPPAGGPEGPPAYAHADQHYAKFHPTNSWIIYFGTDGGVFRSLDRGGTFEGVNGHFTTTQYYNGFSTCLSDENKAMGGLQDNMTVIYEGTTSWRREIGGDGFWTAIHPQDSQTLYGEYYYLALLRSRNGGDSWSWADPPEQAGDQSAFSAPYVLCPSDPTTLYAGRSRVYKSTNEGDDWTATNVNQPLDGSNPALSMAVSWHSADTVYAATAPVASRARVFRTRNGGESWEDITGSLPDRYPADLATDPYNANTVFVAFSGFGSSHLFRSHDGGDTWDDVGGDLPDLPTSAVVVDPLYPQFVYAGNDLGVYLSIDGGDTWEPFSSGMPTVMVSDLKVSVPNRTLRAATHGNGVYERDLYEPSGGVGERPIEQLALRAHPNGDLSFELPAGGRVRLDLFDSNGRCVRALIDEERAAGAYRLSTRGAGLASGVYFARLRAADQTRTARVLHVR